MRSRGGDILQVLFVSLLFGFALSLAGPAPAKPLVDLLDALTRVVFGVVAILMRFAPIGAFWRHGLHHRQIRFGFLGSSRQIDGHALHYIDPLRHPRAGEHRSHSRLRNPALPLVFFANEILLVLATSSSEPALPLLMAKLEKLGCSKALVGPGCPHRLHLQCRRHEPLHDSCRLIRGSGDQHPSNAYPAIHDPGLSRCSPPKARAGVQGAAFIALVATMMVIPTIPVCRKWR